jgi:hypothetical protein
VGSGNHTFGEEESGGEFFIVAWGSHGDADAAAANADLQRLLDDQFVGSLLDAAVAPAKDIGFAAAIGWDFGFGGHEMCSISKPCRGQRAECQRNRLAGNNAEDPHPHPPEYQGRGERGNKRLPWMGCRRRR